MNRFVRYVALLALLLSVIGAVAVSAQETVNITIRCKSSPPEEDWRCNNFAEVEEEVEAELGIELNLTLLQDNIDWGRLQERVRAFVGSRHAARHHPLRP
jgi:hypothetical protein